MQLNDERLAALEAIREGAILDPEAVVLAAKPKSHVLHDCFNWNNGDAAHKYRVWQARQLIRYAVRYIDTPSGEPVRTRVYQSLHNEKGYRATVDILDNVQLRQRLVGDVYAELRRIRDKYGHVQELAAIWQAVDDQAA
jgi:hypothetical protein